MPRKTWRPADRTCIRDSGLLAICRRSTCNKSQKYICVDGSILEYVRPRANGMCAASFLPVTVTQASDCPYPAFTYCFLHEQRLLNDDKLRVANRHSLGAFPVQLTHVRESHCTDGLPDLRANNVKDALKAFYTNNKWNTFGIRDKVFVETPYNPATNYTVSLYIPSNGTVVSGPPPLNTLAMAICLTRKAVSVECIYPDDLRKMTLAVNGTCDKDSIFHTYQPPSKCNTPSISLCIRQIWAAPSDPHNPVRLVSQYPVRLDIVPDNCLLDLDSAPNFQPAIAMLMQGLRNAFPPVRAQTAFPDMWIMGADGSKETVYRYSATMPLRIVERAKGGFAYHVCIGT